MYKRLIFLIVIIIAILLYMLALVNPVASTDPQYGDNIVLMNGSSQEDQMLLIDQPSYIKIYDDSGEEKASYKLEQHWDYINYNESNEIILYNKTTKMCGIFIPNNESNITPYSCEDNYSNNIDNVMINDNNSSLYIQKDNAVLYYDEAPSFEESYNEINTTYLIVDFVEFRYDTLMD